MCPVAVAEIIIICIYFILPTVPSGVPVNEHFAAGATSSTRRSRIAILVGGAMLWWVLSAKNWFTGPVRTIDGDDPDAIAITAV